MRLFSLNYKQLKNFLLLNRLSKKQENQHVTPNKLSKTKQETKFLLGLYSTYVQMVRMSNTSISEDTEPQGSSRQNQMHVASSRCIQNMESLRCSC